MTARKDGWLAQSDFDPHNLSKSARFLGLVVRPITVSREVQNTARRHCWLRVEIYEIVDSWLESIISNIVRMEPCTDGHVWELIPSSWTPMFLWHSIAMVWDVITNLNVHFDTCDKKEKEESNFQDVRSDGASWKNNIMIRCLWRISLL